MTTVGIVVSTTQSAFVASAPTAPAVTAALARALDAPSARRGVILAWAAGLTAAAAALVCGLFLGAAPVGSLAKGRSVPLKTGRRMSVWQTTIETADGKAVAVVIQTQLVL